MKQHEAGMLAELVDPVPTWETVREGAMRDPVLYHLVHMDAHDYADRETLLIATVLWLARSRRELIEAEIRRRMNQPMPELGDA